MASLRRPCLPGVCSSASGASSCAPAPPCGLARPRRHASQLPTSSGALKSAGALQECFGRPASPPACHCGSAYQLQAGLRLGEVRPGGRAQGQITKPLGSSRLSCAQTPCYVGNQGCNDGDGVPPAMHSARDVEKDRRRGRKEPRPSSPVGAAELTGSSTDAAHCSLDETVSCPSVRKLSFPNICDRAM